MGWFVVLPKLYNRRTCDWFLKERTAPLLAELFAWMATLDRRTTRAVYDLPVAERHGERPFALFERRFRGPS